jgi:ankyrin repeat protein
MHRRVARVFKALNRRGMTRAYARIGVREFVFPPMPESKRRVKRVYIIALAAALLVSAGMITWNRLSDTTPREPVYSGTSIRHRDRYGLTRLHHAVIERDMGKVKRLLHWGFAIDDRDAYGWTPLHWAVFKGDAPICRCLMDRGAQVHSQARRRWFKYPAGLTPLDLADLKGNPVIKDILKPEGEEKDDRQ